MAIFYLDIDDEITSAAARIRGTRDLAGLYRPGERLLVYYASPRAVYNAYALLHHSELFIRYHVLRLIRERRMNGYKVRNFDQFIKRDYLYAQLFRDLLSHKRIVYHDLHAKSDSSLSDLFADTPHADNS